MAEVHSHGPTVLQSISSALVKLHKEQFGRGPTQARADFAGPDTLICVLRDVLLPAERKLVAMGSQDRVRDSRVAFQAATSNEFISTVEQILDRKVRAFASGIDPDNDVAFETYLLEPASTTVRSLKGGVKSAT